MNSDLKISSEQMQAAVPVTVLRVRGCPNQAGIGRPKHSSPSAALFEVVGPGPRGEPGSTSG